ncbi:MAG: YceI family protein [Pseudonocardia sp.]|nr:YceI family protein [Pseudonocardia sp.]
MNAAEVSLFDGSGRRAAHSFTDDFGCFAAAVSPGRYRLRVGVCGYHRAYQNIEVGWGTHKAVGKLVIERDDSLTVPPTGLYEIDPGHSAVRFVAQHIAMTRVHGQFTDFVGRVLIADPFMDSQVEVHIDTASVFTNNEKRDEHLRSGDFLDVEHFPTMSFTSNRFSRARGNRWLIDGNLSLRGMTSDLQLDTTYLGTRHWNGRRAGARATTELHLDHFSVSWQQMLSGRLPVVSRSIGIELDVQAVLAE